MVKCCDTGVVLSSDGKQVECMTLLPWLWPWRMWCKNEATRCEDMTGLASRDDKKDVDTGTNLVCEDSRLNIRNGTPSQLIFHSHESDNREIETNKKKKKNSNYEAACSRVLTVGLCVWPCGDIKVLCVRSAVLRDPRDSSSSVPHSLVMYFPVSSVLQVSNLEIRIMSPRVP